MAGLVIPTPDYVRFVTHYQTRPDFCEGADPESKGIVEALVGYVKSDLMIPEELSVADLKGANAKGVAWCNEVNTQVHSEIAAVPAERLALERPLLGADTPHRSPGRTAGGRRHGDDRVVGRDHRRTCHRRPW